MRRAATQTVSDLAVAIRSLRGAFITVAVFSGFLNLLMLVRLLRLTLPLLFVMPMLLPLLLHMRPLLSTGKWR